MLTGQWIHSSVILSKDIIIRGMWGIQLETIQRHKEQPLYSSYGVIYTLYTVYTSTYLLPSFLIPLSSGLLHASWPYHTTSLCATLWIKMDINMNIDDCICIFCHFWWFKIFLQPSAPIHDLDTVVECILSHWGFTWRIPQESRLLLERYASPFSTCPPLSHVCLRWVCVVRMAFINPSFCLSGFGHRCAFSE